MAQVMQIFSTVAARNLRLLQPQQICCQHMIKYSEKIHEAGKAKENVHFLKMQREQLKELRKKIVKERDIIKNKIAELDEQIKSIKKKSGLNKEKESAN